MATEPARRAEPAAEAPAGSLGLLVDRLHPAVLDVLAAPRGLEVEVSHPVILDPADPVAPDPASLVLAVGVGEAIAKASIMRRLASTGATGVVFKQAGAVEKELLALADETGLALLAVRPGISWGQLFSLIATASTVSPPAEGGVYGVPLGDLFALANAVAAMVGGATTIEDLQSRVLAYSSLDHPIDVPRQETILGRQVPSEWMQRLRDAGVFRRLWQTDEVVHIRDFTDFAGYLPRIAVSVRAGGELVGSIWVIEGERALGPEAEGTLRQAADIAALHLLAHRSAHDVDRQRRADALLAVLEGRDRGDRAAALLGIDPRGTMAVVAFDCDEPDDAAAAVRAHRVADLVALYCESFRRRAACAVSGGRVYALVPVGAGEGADSVVNLAGAIVQRAGEALSVPLRAGVGSPVPTVAGLVESRHEADDVLDVLAPGAGVGTISEVRARVVLHRLAQLAQQHPELRGGKLLALADQDAARGTAHLATLRAYFDSFGDIATAAARVSVHPNTFRYRLRRITEAFGLDLADPEERLVAELQLRFLDTTGETGAG
ncbi:MAG TPA: helix-turn-helix domain-containing protein [Acidimicrobiales bacterium]|nr:helix-turn-helix domain-containing protein [Acidimicrobiales bacterium]